MSDKQTPFERLSAINVNGKTEKKGKFTYLSWTFAVEELMKADASANWEIHEPRYYGQQVMVSCTVTAFDKPVYMWLPVIDFKNAPINNPTVMDINKAQMRCLVKAIACHGLGLYIYTGEDLLSETGGQEQAQALPTLDDERFSSACNAVVNGSFDKKRLLTQFELTPEQRQIAVGL